MNGFERVDSPERIVLRVVHDAVASTLREAADREAEQQPVDALRHDLMPINRRHPLGELIAALKRSPMPPRRRITIEYTLIQGIDGGPTEARALARLLRGVPVTIDLIPMNPISATPFQMPAPERIEAFQYVLREAGDSVFVRRQRGDEVNAARGQLALDGAEPKRRRLPTLPTAEEEHG